MSRSEWLTETDNLLRKTYSIDHVDAGWDDRQIDGYFAYDMSPQAFVNWYGEKYDLIGFERY